MGDTPVSVKPVVPVARLSLAKAPWVFPVAADQVKSRFTLSDNAAGFVADMTEVYSSYGKSLVRSHFQFQGSSSLSHGHRGSGESVISEVLSAWDVCHRNSVMQGKAYLNIAALHSRAICRRFPHHKITAQKRLVAIVASVETCQVDLRKAKRSYERLVRAYRNFVVDAETTIASRDEARVRLRGMTDEEQVRLAEEAKKQKFFTKLTPQQEVARLDEAAVACVKEVLTSQATCHRNAQRFRSLRNTYLARLSTAVADVENIDRDRADVSRSALEGFFSASEGMVSSLEKYGKQMQAAVEDMDTEDYATRLLRDVADCASGAPPGGGDDGSGGEGSAGQGGSPVLPDDEAVDTSDDAGSAAAAASTISSSSTVTTAAATATATSSSTSVPGAGVAGAGPDKAGRWRDMVMVSVQTDEGAMATSGTGETGGSETYESAVESLCSVDGALELTRALKLLVEAAAAKLAEIATVEGSFHSAWEGLEKRHNFLRPLASSAGAGAGTTEQVKVGDRGGVVRKFESPSSAEAWVGSAELFKVLAMGHKSVCEAYKATAKAGFGEISQSLGLHEQGLLELQVDEVGKMTVTKAEVARLASMVAATQKELRQRQKEVSYTHSSEAATAAGTSTVGTTGVGAADTSVEQELCGPQGAAPDGERVWGGASGGDGGGGAAAAAAAVTAAAAVSASSGADDNAAAAAAAAAAASVNSNGISKRPSIVLQQNSTGSFSERFGGGFGSTAKAMKEAMRSSKIGGALGMETVAERLARIEKRVKELEAQEESQLAALSTYMVHARGVAMVATKCLVHGVKDHMTNVGASLKDLKMSMVGLATTQQVVLGSVVPAVRTLHATKAVDVASDALNWRRSILSLADVNAASLAALYSEEKLPHNMLPIPPSTRAIGGSRLTVGSVVPDEETFGETLSDVLLQACTEMQLFSYVRVEEEVCEGAGAGTGAGEGEGMSHAERIARARGGGLGGVLSGGSDDEGDDSDGDDDGGGGCVGYTEEEGQDSSLERAAAKKGWKGTGKNHRRNSSDVSAISVDSADDKDGAGSQGQGHSRGHSDVSGNTDVSPSLVDAGPTSPISASSTEGGSGSGTGEGAGEGTGAGTVAAVAAAAAAADHVSSETLNLTSPELTKFGIVNEDRVVDSYSCAIYPKRGMLTHGRMYVSQNYLAFSGWPELKVVLQLRDIALVEKCSTLGVMNTALEVTTWEGVRYHFGSFLDRDHCYSLLSNLVDVSRDALLLSAEDKKRQAEAVRLSRIVDARPQQVGTAAAKAAAAKSAAEAGGGGGGGEDRTYDDGEAHKTDVPSPSSPNAPAGGPMRVAGAGIGAGTGTGLPMLPATFPGVGTASSSSEGAGSSPATADLAGRAPLPSSSSSAAAAAALTLSAPRPPYCNHVFPLYDIKPLLTFELDASPTELWESSWLHAQDYANFLASEGDLEISITNWEPVSAEAPSHFPWRLKGVFTHVRCIRYAHPRTTMLMFGPKNAPAVQWQYLCMDPLPGAAAAAARGYVLSVTEFHKIPMADVFRVVQCWVFDSSPSGGSRVSVGCSVVFVKSTMLRSQIMGGTKDELQTTVARFEKFLRGATEEYRRVGAAGGCKWAARAPLPPLQISAGAGASARASAVGSAFAPALEGGQPPSPADLASVAGAHAFSAAADDDDSTDRAAGWLSLPPLWVVVAAAAAALLLLLLLYVWWWVGHSTTLVASSDPTAAAASAATTAALEQRLVSMELDLRALRQLLGEQQALTLRLGDQCAAAASASTV